jgi:hypothetical protein
MQHIPEGGATVAEQSHTSSEIRPGTPKCEITYDFDPKGVLSPVWRGISSVLQGSNAVHLTDHSPTYVKLLQSRIAIGRRQELEKAARSEEPPDDEELMECCGSRCKPVCAHLDS